MTVERRVGATLDSLPSAMWNVMLGRLDYTIMLFVVALMLIILLHTQLYGGNAALRKSEPTSCQLKKSAHTSLVNA
jgi:hypothetical protein